MIRSTQYAKRNKIGPAWGLGKRKFLPQKKRIPEKDKRKRTRRNEKNKRDPEKCGTTRATT